MSTEKPSSVSTSEKPSPLRSFFTAVLLACFHIFMLAVAFAAGAIFNATVATVQINGDSCREIDANQDHYIGWKLQLDPGYKSYLCAESKETTK